MPKAYKALPSCELLWERYEYKPLTGELVRIRKDGLPGTTFGCTNTKGYTYGMINGSSFYAHRLVWAWLHGEDPGTLEVDHINRDRADNTPWNLRLVPRNKQAHNISYYKNNRLGVRGVSRIPNSNRYVARIRIAGKVTHLGCFDTIEEASSVYEREYTRRLSRIEEVETTP